MRPSTKAVIDEGRAHGKGMTSMLHGYVYGRWTWQYIWSLMNIRFPLAGQAGKEKWAEHYHAKTLTLDQAESIISMDRDIPLRDLEQIVPYSTARKFVLHAPADVVLYECGCRRAAGAQCSPLQVCMIIGKPFTDFILDQHPDKARRVSQEEALQVLKDEQERGHIHTAWFKDAMMDRFYAICNCCKCHCGGIRAMVKFGSPMLAPSGYVAEVDTSKCNTCGKCADLCPFDAVTGNGDTMLYEAAKCMGCGVCVDHCPQQARRMVRDPSKGVPLDVNELADRRVEQLVH